MLKLRFDWYITKTYERKLDATNFISSECTSASLRLGPSLYRGSTVALKSFNTENEADFPLLFRGFCDKDTFSLLNVTNFVVDRSFESAIFSFRIQKFPRPHVFGFVAALLFFTLESGFKIIQIRRMRLDGKKKLRIQKYPDTNGQGLNSWLPLAFEY